MKIRLHSQVLIIGSGLAGCTAALTLADKGIDVLIISSEKDLGGGNSELAQGGIIYKAANGNDATALKEDILHAGHRYNHTKAVEHLCQHGPEAIEKILMQRVVVPFAKDSQGGWNLTREGGHSLPRILHTADFTGASIMKALTAEVRNHPRITCLLECHAIDLLTSRHHGRRSDYRYKIKNRCVGAYVFNNKYKQVQTILAPWTILATGGIGGIYLHSTNTPICVGSAISMAHRAHVALENMEFMQFHPTALYSKLRQQCHLITEAMRGEGAKLLDANGNAFMHKYDSRQELAPRDIVSQAMVNEMLSTGAPCLFLDASPIEQNLKTRFPTIYKNCLTIGVDILNDYIPVVPAAHYFCGGILTNLQGKTELQGLYAVGECACTGVHGANRLASTSLMEAVTWGYEAGKDIALRCNNEIIVSHDLACAIPDWEHMGRDQNDDPALLAQDWATIRHTMWNYVGITRNTARLRRAFQDLRELSRHIHDFYKHTHITPQLIQLFHGVQTAYVITQAALRNRKSLGCHYRVD